MNTSTEINEIIKAIHAFQGQVGKMQRTATNPFFKSSYTPISEVLDVIREPLQTAGLSFVQFPSGEHGLTTRLMHNSGQWLEDTIIMQPSKNDPQGQGSAITYARRYSLVAILGLSDEDDDGNKASKPADKTNDSQSVTTMYCPDHKVPAKQIPAGVSKTGKAYSAFYACAQKDEEGKRCAAKPVMGLGATLNKDKAPF